MKHNDLYNQIWITRKCRINAEKRLLRYALISDILIPYYSLVLILINFIPTFSSSKYFTNISVSLSICILVVSLFISGQQYRLRASNIKNHYIELQKLLSELMTNRNPYKIHKQYEILLSQVENHSDFDYLCLKFQMKNVKSSNIDFPTKLEHVKYFVFAYILKYTIIIILFSIGLLPFILMI